VQSAQIFAAGLFNGDAKGAAIGGVSHRAAIPAYHVSLSSSAKATLRYIT